MKKLICKWPHCDWEGYDSQVNSITVEGVWFICCPVCNHTFLNWEGQIPNYEWKTSKTDKEVM